MPDAARRYIDTPFSWALVGFVIGLALGVNTASVWLIALGLGAFAGSLFLRGQAEEKTEGRIFAAGPALMMSWVLGFIVHSLAF